MKIDLVPMDAMNPEHGRFLYQLFKESADPLWDDKHRDILANIADLVKRPLHFIVMVEDQQAGYIGAIVDDYECAYLEGASLKAFQRFYPARQTLFKFCKTLFKDYGIRKIKAQVPVFNRQAELILRSVGFDKEGLSKKELLYNKKYRDVLNLYVFPAMLKVKHGRKEKKRTTA